MDTFEGTCEETRGLGKSNGSQGEGVSEAAVLADVRLVAALPRLPIAKRWLALHEPTQTSRMMYRFKAGDAVARCATALDGLKSFNHGHVLGIEAMAADRGGDVWVDTLYPGNQDGLVTLAGLLEAKGGRMSPHETMRALEHLLDAAGAAHEAGLCHGWLSLDEVLVDPRGRLLIELYGVPRAVAAPESAAPVAELRRDELTSIAAIGYRLLTGQTADEPRVAVSRFVPRLDRGLEAFIERGLDASTGFESAGEAMLWLAGRDGAERRGAGLGGAAQVIGRLRRAVARGDRRGWGPESP